MIEVTYLSIFGQEYYRIYKDIPEAEEEIRKECSQVFYGQFPPRVKEVVRVLKVNDDDTTVEQSLECEVKLAVSIKERNNGSQNC